MSTITSPELLDIAKKRFANGLWHSSGWANMDRRCIVGTLRDISGTGREENRAVRKDPEQKNSWDREPYFTAYEEVIFACCSIVDPSFNAVETYKMFKKRGVNDRANQYIAAGFGKTHGAILATLDHAEHQLIHYNDVECKSAEEMIALMEEATAIVKAQRDARESEFTGSTQSIINSALAAGIPETAVVVGSVEDAEAARKEYDALRAENPDLPPVFSFFMNDKGSKKRVAARGRIKDANKKAKHLVR